MKIIGITGSIGCGKTTVAKIISNMGYDVFDADNEVRSIYKNSDFLFLLKRTFPKVFCGDILDKRMLRNLVFSNEKELLKLEDIIAPFLSDIFLKKISEVSKLKGFLFIDAALLFEKGWSKYCDIIICVDVDLETQKNRVMKRDNISEKEFFDIYNLQMKNEKKCELSDEVINTDCSTEKLELKVKELLNKLKVN